MARAATAAALVAALAGATGRGAYIPTHEELVRLLGTRHGAGDVPPDFECGWRAFALQYASVIQPQLTAAAIAAIHDGLELTTLCNQTLGQSMASAHSAAAAAGGLILPRAQRDPRVAGGLPDLVTHESLVAASGTGVCARAATRQRRGRGVWRGVWRGVA